MVVEILQDQGRDCLADIRIDRPEEVQVVVHSEEAIDRHLDLDWVIQQQDVEQLYTIAKDVSSSQCRRDNATVANHSWSQRG